MRFNIKFVLIDRLLIIFLSIIMLFFVFFVIIICSFDIDITARGHGIVKCRNWTDIKTEINGIISEINVTDGEMVEKDEVLFKLEDRERKQEVEDRIIKIQILNVKKNKLNKQVTLVEKRIISEINESQSSLDGANARYRIAMKGPKPEEISLAKTTIKSAEMKLEKTIKDFKLATTAYSLKLISKQDLENALYKKKVGETELKISQEELKLIKNRFDKNQIAEAKANVTRYEAVLRKAMARETEVNILKKDLENIQNEIEKEKNKLSVSKEHLRLTTVKSPIKGYVLTHETEHLSGKSVRSGEVVLRIGDSNDYMIDCKISEKDIPIIKIGQKAKVQIKPFPKGEYKIFQAEVIRIGAESLSSIKNNAEEILSKNTDNSQNKDEIFPVFLDLEKPYSIQVFGNIYKIKPGLSAEVEIITQQESLLLLIIRRILRIKGDVLPENIHL